MIYVIPQFLLIAACFFVADLRALSLFSVSLLTVSILLGLWAVICMKPGHFNVRPIPQKDAVLVNHGPYSLIRHPMYSSVLLLCLGLVISSETIWSIYIWLLLAVVLVLKLLHEEKLLQTHFPGYFSYMKNTRRLIPFIF
jgi:protein-S-isoprenylcysteine O-methyltransferase Ste14